MDDRCRIGNVIFSSFRIRKLSLNFLSPDEDRPLVEMTASSDAIGPAAGSHQPLPSIVIQQPESSTALADDRQGRTSSMTSNQNNDTKL